MLIAVAPGLFVELVVDFVNEGEGDCIISSCIMWNFQQLTINDSSYTACDIIIIPVIPFAM